MNVYIFNEGLLAPNHGDPNQFESFRMEAYQIFGTPEEIWAHIESVALPVELLSFDVEKTKENQVAIQWETASEINHDYFTIERSKDASNWEAIKKVKTPNTITTNATKSYAALDEFPLTGLSFYRLKQTDLDGTSTYSVIKNVSIDLDSSPKIDIYPNPTSEIVHIQLNELVVETITLLDNLGNDLTASVKQVSKGEDTVVLNLENLPVGAYYIVLNGDIVEKVQRK